MASKKYRLTTWKPTKYYADDGQPLAVLADCWECVQRLRCHQGEAGEVDQSINIWWERGLSVFVAHRQ